MGKKLYVGNLSYGISDSSLEQLFSAHGSVQSAQVIMDRDTGRSKGIGFVEMGSDEEAQAAIGMRTVYTLTGTRGAAPDWKGERGRVDKDLLRRAVPDHSERTFMVAGSPAFVAHVKKELRSLGVGRRRIKADLFQGY